MEARKFFMGSFYNGGCVPKEFFPEKRVLVSDQKAAAAAAAAGEQHFMVDDLLDFPTDDDAIIADGFLDNNTSNNYVAKSGNINMVADNSSNFTSGNDSCNSSGSGNVGYQSFANSHFSNELCVPYDDLAELEWLSNFVEDSFSTKQNLQTNFQILTGSKPLTPESSSSETHQEQMMTRNPTNNPIFQREITLPGKARSKRSRAAPCDWSTRLLHVSAAAAKGHPKKQEKPNPNPNSNPDTDGQIRKCQHCGAEKTPQWRTGPMGPKTLCNACGVRYKSGRLVPEYRPAASPTFVASKHSNSHRKVLELRRQKEFHRVQQEHFLNQNSIFAVSTGGDDFLIHHHSGPHFRHMI